MLIDQPDAVPIPIHGGRAEALSVFEDPLFQPFTEGHAAFLCEIRSCVVAPELFQFRQQFFLRSAEDGFENWLAVFLVTDNDAAFPPSVAAFTHQPVAVRSSFCHSLSPVLSVLYSEDDGKADDLDEDDESDYGYDDGGEEVYDKDDEYDSTEYYDPDEDDTEDQEEGPIMS